MEVRDLSKKKALLEGEILEYLNKKLGAFSDETGLKVTSLFANPNLDIYAHKLAPGVCPDVFSGISIHIKI